MEKDTKYRSANIRGIDKDEFNKTRTVTFVASTNDVDRHGTRLNQDNWKLDNFRNNPIIGYQHNVYGDGLCEKPTPDDIIGKGKNIRVEEGKLLIDIEFKPEGRSEIADKVAEDVRDGFLNTVSVGFLPVGEGRMIEEKDGVEVYHFDGQELLELSVVNIPSNAKALKKSLREQTARGIMWVKKALGDGYSFADIESMTIRNIMDLIEGRKYETFTSTTTDPVKPLEVDDTGEEVYKYNLLKKQELLKRKNDNLRKK